MVLELPAHRIEAIADRDVDVFMGMVLGRIALHDDLLARNLEIDTNMKKAALAMAPAGGLDDDATADDPVMELLELRDTLAYLRLHCRRRVNMAERDLKQRLHERSSNLPVAAAGAKPP